MVPSIKPSDIPSFLLIGVEYGVRVAVPSSIFDEGQRFGTQAAVFDL